MSRDPIQSVLSTIRSTWRKVPIDIRRKVRSVVGPTRYSKVNQLVSSGKVENFGLLSVVIPVYNVEKYLTACLTSVVSQTYRNLEIIIVNDGSTDGSSDIIKKYASSDKRIKLITLENSGNGIARNKGILSATGDYLTFADSDDVVPTDAYASMLSALDASKSDFVVGSFERIHGTKRWSPELAKSTHAIDRIGITVEDFPEIIHDIFLWNKIFRVEFWKKSVGSLPEGILYEDQETIIRSYLRSASFDVIKKCVYAWRVRDDNSSITQQKGDLQDLKDRLEVAMEVSSLVEEDASATIKRAWYEKLLGPDFRLYIEQIPKTDDEYWQNLHVGLTTIVQKSGADILRTLSVRDRILVSLVVEGWRDDVSKVLLNGQENGWSYPVAESSIGLIAQPAYISEIDHEIDPRSLLVSDREFVLKTKIHSYKWISSDVLNITGHAYIQNISDSTTRSNISISLVNRDKGAVVLFTVARGSDVEIDQSSGDRWNSYSNSKFEAELNIAPLRSSDSMTPLDPSFFDVVVNVTNLGVSRSGNILARDKERLTSSFDLAEVEDRRRVIAVFDGTAGLSLRFVEYRVLCTDAVIEHGRVRFTLDAHSGLAVSSVHLSDGKAGKRSLTLVPVPGGGMEISGEIPKISPLSKPSTQQTWTPIAVLANGKTTPIGWSGSSDGLQDLNDETSPSELVQTGYGYLQLRVRRWRVVATSASLDALENKLFIGGRIALASSEEVHARLPKLCLATGRDILWPSKMEFDPLNGVYEAEFALTTDKWGLGPVAVSPGAYGLRYANVEGNVLSGAPWVPVVGELAHRIPEVHDLAGIRITITRTEALGALVVKFGPTFKASERGGYQQQGIRSEIATRRNTLRDIALFESFGGKNATDSVRAIHDEVAERGTSMELYWSVRDSSVQVPPGAKSVLIYSREWYDVLNSACMLVNNNNFPNFFRKTPGQTYIQTWHGTPLKRIGNDAPKTHLSLSYQETMKRESSYWDVLLAQSPYAASLISPAFDFDGQVEALGYPRNDSLADSNSDSLRINTRRRLGIKEGSLVVLYAPTWRDNVRTSNNQFDFVTYLDFARIRRSFGDKVTLLLRGHHNIAGQRFTSGSRNFLDVSEYPEINDLYLAADVLITDYSSVMFDFAVTRKPMIFMTPDIELYRDKTRGFYFDLEETAPGPVVRTTDEVILALDELQKGTGSSLHPKYDGFVKKFAPFDDGNAASRVVDSIWPN